MGSGTESSGSWNRCLTRRANRAQFYRCGRVYNNVYSVDMDGSIVDRQEGEGKGSLNPVPWRNGMGANKGCPKRKERVSTQFLRKPGESQTRQRELYLFNVFPSRERRQNPVPGMPKNPFGLRLDETTFLQIVQYSQLQLRGILKDPRV